MKSNQIGKGEVINIGSGENHSIVEVAKMISRKTKVIAPRKGEVRLTLADISLAKKLLGWKPTVKLIDGIEELR